MLKRAHWKTVKLGDILINDTERDVVWIVYKLPENSIDSCIMVTSAPKHQVELRKFPISSDSLWIAGNIGDFGQHIGQTLYKTVEFEQ